MDLRHTIRGHLLFSSKMYSSDLGCCGCCSALRPRYKRLVDNIFPVQPQDGLVKSNMEKLTYYSLSSPEKLDRIGEYLFQKASRDIYRRRHGYTIIKIFNLTSISHFCKLINYLDSLLSQWKLWINYCSHVTHKL